MHLACLAVILAGARLSTEETIVRVPGEGKPGGGHYLRLNSSDAGAHHFRYVRSRDCRKQFSHFMEELSNNAPWAVKMFEATSKYPVGLLSGNDYQFGDYDECVSVNSPDRLVQGKYCLADVHVTPDPRHHAGLFRYGDEYTLEYNPYGSYVEKFRVSGDPSQKRRNVIHTGICIPKACSWRDVEEGLNGYVREMAVQYGFNASVTLPVGSCSTNDARGYATGGKIVWGIILILSKLVILSTVWDMLRQDQKTAPKSKILLAAESFSLRRNLTKLTSSSSSGEFDAFHGMKVLSMMMIILGHRCMASFGGPVFNANFLEEGYRSFSTILLLNGILIVDTFFLIGGFLTFTALHHELKKRNELSTFQVCLHRWLRITPDYMLMVFFYGYVLENLGSGPIWSAKVGREAERCRENWWSNLLFINNYVNANQLCMFQSWYVACDFHYMIISPAIVKLVSKMGKAGLLLLTGSILASSISVSVVTYLNEYDGIMKIYYNTLSDIASSPFFSEMYIKSHNRITPYLSGMTAAYIYLKLKESNVKISKVTIWFTSLLSLFLGLFSICAARVFYIPGREYDAIENALFASMHRVLWSLSMGWIAISTARKSYGIIQPILTAKAYIPISKLTFGAYLIHGAVQMYTTASLRTPEYMSFPKLFWMTSGDIMLSFFFAFLLHVLVEAPMKGIKQLLFTK